MSSRSSAAIVALALSLFAQAPPASVAQLRHDIDAILAAPALDRGFWGVLVKSLDTDETWYSLNAGKLMMPASTMKVITLAAAAEKLGWDFRYDTRLSGTGPVSDGVLHGDLLVVGSGDPSIDDWDGAATKLFGDWAAQLKAAGIQTIDGRIVGDDNAFDDEGIGFGWSWDDLPAGFAAGVSALQFNAGSVRLTLAPGATAGAKAMASLSPASGGLTVSNQMTTGAANSPAMVVRRRLPGTSRLELRGSLPLRSRPFSQVVSVDNPTMYFVTALRGALVAGGIDVRGPAVDIDDLAAVPARNGTAPLITYQSPPLSMLAMTMMKLSQNQYAEALFKTIGVDSVSKAPATAESGRAAVQSVLQSWSIPTSGLIQADGSGLSRYNYVTPETLVAVLAHINRDERLRSGYEATLPIAGRDGLLQNRMRGTAAEGNARAKNGSMANVRAMTGYVRTADGELLTFAIFANNFENSSSVINAATDAIVVRLATFHR